MVAVGAFADPAGNADGFKGLWVGDVQTVSVNQRARVFDLATKADGVAAGGRAPMSALFADGAGQAEVAASVRGFGELAQETPRGFKGHMHVPERARAAKAGKLKGGGRMAFGDRAGLIHADKEKRNAALAWSLQGGKAVRDLFDGSPKHV